jgi:hypothetical protein
MGKIFFARLPVGYMDNAIFFLEIVIITYSGLKLETASLSK